MMKNHKYRLFRRRFLNYTNLYKKSPDKIYELRRDRDYYVLLEYPKCGRTWLRYMICQAESIKYKVPLKNTIFDIVYIKYKLPRVYYVHGFNTFKTFDEYFYKNLFNTYYAEKGNIFLVRQPERVMVSYYHQIKNRTNHNFNGDISDFIKDENFGMKKYVEYVEYYLKHIKRKKHLVVRYEDVKENTYAELKRILDFIEIHLEEEEIRKIVKNSQFEIMKDMEQKRKYKVSWLLNPKGKSENASKIRKGGNEDLTKIFSVEDLDYMKSQYETSFAFNELKYI